MRKRELVLFLAAWIASGLITFIGVAAGLSPL